MIYNVHIIIACSDTLPSDPSFLLELLEATTTSSRDISAQTTALLLSAVSIALATRTKSVTLLPVAPVR